ncbi:hypothetical protein [Actinoplanes sp. NPDC026623]|uniref:hypothetical protein n=1 Tax=Actinoplanes sp. NPDC026623 TaxID=3155610 RepID=UPI0033F38B62
MPTAQSVPTSVRDEVAKILYAEAEALDWERLPAQLKSGQYNQWADDPRIGGLLARFIPNPLGWIKEVPLKEYARALENMGRFASFTTMHYAPPADFIRPTFGRRWEYVPNSQGDKPAHCLATDGTTTRYICWGPPGQCKELLWAAVTAGLEHQGHPAIALSVRSDAEIDNSVQRKHERIGERCGIEIRYMVRPLRQRT